MAKILHWRFKTKKLLDRRDMRFNINCFFIYAIPYLLMIPMLLNRTVTSTKNFCKMYRKAFKSFTQLPDRTASELIDEMTGTSG